MSDSPPPPGGRPGEPDPQHGDPSPYGDSPYGTPPAYGAPPPYGQAPPPPGYPGQPYGHGYGYGPVSHSGATTSMVLGISSIAVAVVGACLCGFLGILGAVVGPFGIWQGQRARAEIDAEPGRYDNRGHAVAGFVCGIVGTVIGALVMVAIVVMFAIVGFGAFPGPGY